MNTIRSCGAVVLTMLAGCGLSVWVADNFPSPAEQYPRRDFYGAVVPAGRPGISGISHVDELVTLYGPPDLILEARPRNGDFRDGTPAASYVYYPRDGRHCYDAFVVILATGRVVRHYCR